MDYFKGNKYQAIHENIPYVAAQIYNILFKEKTIEEIIESYLKLNNVSRNINIEKNIEFAIIFLFSIGKVEYNNNIIKRVE